MITQDVWHILFGLFLHRLYNFCNYMTEKGESLRLRPADRPNWKKKVTERILAFINIVGQDFPENSTRINL